MSARRGESGLSGILLVDKPSGLTSHDVVNRVRRITGERRVGHAGTLDPLATGLLVVLVGPATRLASYLTAAEKRYFARIVFGSETDTDDAEGRIVGEAQVPASVCDRAEAVRAVEALVGEHEQIPPAYSAIKRGGVTAYEAARKGEALELEPRTIRIDDARLVTCDAGARAWDVDLSVSKGTYIRAIARDLGRSLGTAAHLGALRRTRSGSLDVADATELDEILHADSPAQVAGLFVDPLPALGVPVIEVDDAQAAVVATGGTLPREVCDAVVPASDAPAPAEQPRLLDGAHVAVAHKGVLLGVYAVSDGRLKAETVIPGGVTGGRA